MTTARWTALTAVLLAILGAAAFSLLRSKPTERRIRYALFEEIRPVALTNCKMERFGSANDGGYLMCGNLLSGVQSGYSYGIGPNDDWGCEVSVTLGVPVHQYDCFDPSRPACPKGRTIFHDECIGAKAEVVDSRTFDTLTRQISKNGDDGKALAVKIDVEGAELNSLRSTPDEVLRRIDQLAIELHGVNAHYLELVRKLKRTFYPAHIHFNNHACASGVEPFPSWAYQILFVNKRIGIRDHSRSPVLPHPLDAPDLLTAPDCQQSLHEPRKH
jgi:hypothetical protein